MMPGIIIYHIIFGNGYNFDPKPGNHGFEVKTHSDDNRATPGRGLFLFWNNTPLEFWDLFE